MTITPPKRLAIDVGTGPALRRIEIEQRDGNAPGLFWLGGYRSDMAGSKALTLDALGAEKGLAVTRFDYSGHGISGGDFNDGTISRWLEEAEAVMALTQGEQIVVGSSMGGWLALLLAKRLLEKGKPVKGLLLIAPAPDMTHALMLPGFSPEERAQLEGQGYVEQPSLYSDQPYRITKALIEDGARHLLFGGVIETGCPVIILQGGKDPDVPPAHALALVTRILHDPVTLTMVPDGDHRLSRAEDLERMRAAVLQLAANQP